MCEGNFLCVLSLCFSAVHRCFFTLDKTHIASFSDDKSVCLWDIPSENKVTSFSEHLVSKICVTGNVNVLQYKIFQFQAWNDSLCSGIN
jgi:WD40 repeat protein